MARRHLSTAARQVRDLARELTLSLYLGSVGFFGEAVAQLRTQYGIKPRRGVPTAIEVRKCRPRRLGDGYENALSAC